MYVAHHIISTKIELQSNFEEYVFCKIKINKNKTCIIGCIYRSPNSSELNNQKLLELLSEVNSLNGEILTITGDFNYNVINWQTKELFCSQNHPACKAYDHRNDLFWEELIKEPTRFGHMQNPTRDDWILSNNADRISNIEIGSALGRSDHATINFTIDTSFETIETKNNYQYYKGKYDDMRSELEDTDWQIIASSWTSFEFFYVGLVERHIPKKKIPKQNQTFMVR